MDRTLSEQVSEDIIAMIKYSGLKPGDRLKNEYELAKELNVGRSTLREAIRSLASRNIVTIQQGSGTYVSDEQGIPTDPLGLTFVDDDRLGLDLSDIRLWLEPQTALLAAINGTDEQKKTILENCNRTEEKIKKGNNYAMQDINFHKSIAEASGNKVMANLLPIVLKSVVYSIDITKDQYRDDTVFYHRKITNAILDSDVEGARTAMMIHIDFSRESICRNYLQRCKEKAEMQGKDTEGNEEEKAKDLHDLKKKVSEMY
jgi:DNA-binding FadR family transcriptional regulator